MLTIYKPRMEELWFKQKMMQDEATMSYNHAYGGTISFPEERWKEWYARWISDESGKRYYRYLKDASGSFVGEISYHQDESVHGYMCDVVILASFRKKGYGSEALGLLCQIALENGITELSDEIALDNPAISLFLRNGFKEAYRTKDTAVLKKIL